MSAPSNPVSSSILNAPFLKSDKPQITEALEPHLIREVANITADYLIHAEAFTATDWQRVFRLETAHLDIDSKFYKFWASQDKIDPTKFNHETHFQPIFRPPGLGLAQLNALAQNPQNGFASSIESPLFIEPPGQPPCYLVARKELLARNLSTVDQRNGMNALNAATNAEYEVLPSALDLATVALVHHAVTGQRFLGNAIGMGNRKSESRSGDMIRMGDNEYAITVGDHSPTVGNVLGSLKIDIMAYDDDRDASNGVVALQKFGARPI